MFISAIEADKFSWRSISTDFDSAQRSLLENKVLAAGEKVAYIRKTK